MSRRPGGGTLRARPGELAQGVTLPVVRKLIPRLLVIGLAWLLTPGLTEAAENLWHIAAAGHAAHAAAAGDEHAPRGDEHGCSGSFHLCACHHSTTPILAQAVGAHAATPAGGRPAGFRAAPSPDPYRAAPFHPPRA